MTAFLFWTAIHCQKPVHFDRALQLAKGPEVQRALFDFRGEFGNRLQAKQTLADRAQEVISLVFQGNSRSEDVNTLEAVDVMDCLRASMFCRIAAGNPGAGAATYEEALTFASRSFEKSPKGMKLWANSVYVLATDFAHLVPSLGVDQCKAVSAKQDADFEAVLLRFHPASNAGLSLDQWNADTLGTNTAAFVRAVLARRMIRLAAAIQEFKWTKNTFPTNLSRFPAKLTEDPITKKPFAYKTNGREFELLSPGNAWFAPVTLGKN